MNNTGTEIVPAAEKVPMPINAGELTPMGILQTAVMTGAPIEHLERLMDLQERFEARESKKSFDKALAAFKANPPSIDKDKAVGYGKTSYTHASLPNVVNKVGSALSLHGLSASWRIAQSNNSITVTCVLSHEAGHSEICPITAGADNSGSKNGIQAIGSTITYLQRYTLLAITGLATGEMDDDGKSGGDAADAKRAPKSVGKTPAPREVNIKAIQAYIDYIAGWKAGVHTSDQFDKEWSKSVEASYEKLPQPEKDFVKAEFDKKIEALEGAK
jgi:hypothetical protein